MSRYQLPSQHRTISFEQTGQPSVLGLQETALPTLGEQELLVRTAATGVNFIETYQRSGVYPVVLPFVPGSEGAGTVIAVGPAVRHFKVGDRITTASATGAYAEHFKVAEDLAVAIPDSIDDRVAAALPLQGMTAHYLVRSTFKVAPEHTVLFHAGAGGVGGLAIQLLKSIGARVITTVSNDEKEAIARAHGADYVIRYENFAQQVQEITAGQGVDVVYDSVGKDTFEQSLASLKVRGTAVLFGGASGQVPPFDLQRLNSLGSLFVTRPTLAHYTRNREEVSWRMGELFEAVESGKLKVSLDQVFTLEQAADAHRYLEARKTRGKVVLVP